jgi:hypothetical protein
MTISSLSSDKGLDVSLKKPKAKAQNLFHFASSQAKNWRQCHKTLICAMGFQLNNLLFYYF